MNNQIDGREKENNFISPSLGALSSLADNVSERQRSNLPQYIKEMSEKNFVHHQKEQPLISIDDQEDQSVNIQRLPLSQSQLNFNQGGPGNNVDHQLVSSVLPGQLFANNQTDDLINLNSNRNQNQEQTSQPSNSQRTQRSQQEVWRVSNINEDLVYDDGQDSSGDEESHNQQVEHQQKSLPNRSLTIQQPEQNRFFQNAQEEDYDSLEERILTEATPSHNNEVEMQETDRYQHCYDSQRNQLLAFTDGPKSHDRFNYEETQEGYPENDEEEGNGSIGDNNDGEPDFHFDSKNNSFYNNKGNAQKGLPATQRISRSKTAQNDINAKEVKSVIPGLKLNNKINDDFVATVGGNNILDYGGKSYKYQEDDVISGALETKKYRISSQQTIQTEGDNLVNHYTTQSAMNSERQSQKSGKANSSIFGSLNLSALRSARQIFPRAFSKLDDIGGIEGQLSSRSKNSNLKKHYPNIPKLEFKKNCKEILRSYKRSCMEGIFLKHILCQSVPLKWYIIFMMALDLFMAIADSLSIYTRGQGILEASTQSERIGMTIAVVFFAIRVLVYIPTCYYSLKLYMYDSRTGGKVLYGLKLAIFVLYILFNLISVGFIMKDGCTAIHIKLPKMNSFSNQVSNQQGSANSVPDPEEQFLCRFSTQILEVIGLSFYYFLSCWIILSILYWIRRSKKGDPSSEFLNLISGANFKTRNPISLNHNKQRPLVKESQIQQRYNKKRGKNMPRYQMQDDSQITEQIDDTPVRINSATKSIHVNLKAAMKNLQDYRTDSQRNRIQKSKPGSASSSQKTRNPAGAPSSTTSTFRAKK